MNSEYVGLVARIEQTLIDLTQVVGRTERILQSGLRSGDDAYFDAVALNLHGFYAGVEQIFENIARTMEGSIPSGSNWHQGLLLQMASKANSIRPAVISVETRRALDEYRMFRHIVRNVYTFNLRPSRLQELTDELRPCFDALVHELNIFSQFLNDVEKE